MWLDPDGVVEIVHEQRPEMREPYTPSVAEKEGLALHEEDIDVTRPDDARQPFQGSAGSDSSRAGRPVRVAEHPDGIDPVIPDADAAALDPRQASTR